MSENQPPPIPDEPKAESKAIVLATNHAVHRAERMADKPDRASRLVDSAEAKADHAQVSIKRALFYIVALIRMLRAHYKKTYRDLPWRTVIWALAALIYFVAPLDLIPDFIFGGFADDVAVVLYVVRQIQKDLDDFLAWESAGAVDEQNENKST